MIRAFIAIDLSHEARKEISRIQDVLKAVDANIKWVDPETIHITLKFLGDIPEDKIPQISAGLENITKTFEPFEITLDKLGVFPKWNFPQIIWVGINDKNDVLSGITADIDKFLREIGFETAKREFKAHATIGRVRSSKNKDKLKNIAIKISIPPIATKISRITLYKSNLTPTGPIYTSLWVG
jgi:RNA 2',3'-cyclic 3'-phosphodiesterase